MYNKSVFFGCESLEYIEFANNEGWYATSDSEMWNNRTGGTLTNVSKRYENADMFTTDSYVKYYWYKK